MQTGTRRAVVVLAGLAVLTLVFVGSLPTTARFVIVAAVVIACPLVAASTTRPRHRHGRAQHTRR